MFPYCSMDKRCQHGLWGNQADVMRKPNLENKVFSISDALSLLRANVIMYGHVWVVCSVAEPVPAPVCWTPPSVPYLAMPCFPIHDRLLLHLSLPSVTTLSTTWAASFLHLSHFSITYLFIKVAPQTAVCCGSIYCFFPCALQVLLHTKLGRMEQSRIPWSVFSLGVSGPCVH